MPRARSDRTAHRPLVPFTVDHFRAYAANLILDTGERWPVERFQLEVVADIFSEVPEVWLVVPEGNGKTTLMGGVALYHADYTESAAVVLGASSRDQCGLLLGQAAGFVYRTPGLLGNRFRVLEGYRRIDALRSGGRIQVYAADDRTGDGIIPTLAMVDELHRHRDMRLYRTWLGKLGKRDGTLVAISTAGEPETEFETARQRARADAETVTVRGFHTRAASPELVLHDFAVPADADIEDLRAVKKANPFSGVTVEHLRRKRRTATMTTSHWRRFVCNQAVRSEESAISEAEWAALRCSDTIPPGEPIWCGADFAWKWDTTALVPYWMPSLEERFIGDPEILTPPRDGHSLPPEDVQIAFLRIHERNPIHTVVMDENVGGAQMAAWIETVLGARVVSHSQGHSAMALAYERWMEAMRARYLRHTGHLELARHVLNAIARLLPGGQTRFDRPVRSRNGAEQDRRVWDALTGASMVHSVAVGEAEAPDRGPEIDVASYRIESL